MWPVDATTGVAFGELTFPPSEPKVITPPLPAGWKTVFYRGIGLDVPDDFAVESWRGSCGVADPTVFIGPARPVVLSCPAFPSDGALVVLGDIPPGETGVADRINGLGALEFTQTRSEVVHGTGPLVTVTRIEATASRPRGLGHRHGGGVRRGARWFARSSRGDHGHTPCRVIPIPKVSASCMGGLMGLSVTHVLR